MTTATIYQFKKPSIARIECSVCGASADASCNCGAPYVPASQRAAQAINDNPTKSDRAIADEIGVSHATVSRARSTVSGETVEKRTGKDGKARKMPTKKSDPETEKFVAEHADEIQSIKDNLAKANAEAIKAIDANLKVLVPLFLITGEMADGLMGYGGRDLLEKYLNDQDDEFLLKQNLVAQAMKSWRARKKLEGKS